MSAYSVNNRLTIERGRTAPKTRPEKDIHPAPNSVHLSGLAKGGNCTFTSESEFLNL